jgi:Tol biopolymer transport system component
MVYCTECGAQNNDTARFCINCGRPLVPPKGRRGLGKKLLVTLLLLISLAAIAGGVYHVMQQLPSGGQWIAYQSIESDNTRSLWVTRPDGEEQSRVMSGVNEIRYTSVLIGDQRHKYSPFSPLDNRMLFQAQEGGVWTLSTYTPGEAKARTILQTADSLSYGFSPDGQKVHVQLRNETEGALQIFDPDGENRRDLVTESNGWVTGDWLTTSKQLIVQPRDAESTGLFVIDVDGKNWVTLADQVDDARCRVPSEKDDIIYGTKEQGLWNVYATGADGSNPVRLAGGFADAQLWGCSPDGRKLIMSTSTDGTSYDLFLVETDGTGRVALASGVESGSGGFIRGTERIYFRVSKGGLWSLYLADVDGGNQSVVTRGVSQLGWAWTPNSRTLIMHVQKDGTWSIFSVEVATGKQVNLLAKADGVGLPIALDNSRVLFSAKEGDNWNLYVASLVWGLRCVTGRPQGGLQRGQAGGEPAVRRQCRWPETGEAGR